MRAFMAFEIPRDIKEYLRTVAKSMASNVSGVRWVRDEGIHVTLKFFGEIDAGTVEEIYRELAYLGEKYRKIETVLGGVDAFPSRKRARVIIVNLEKEVDIMKSIFNDIEGMLTGLGFQRENRSFKPHITLGRKKVPSPILEREIPPLEKKSFVLHNIVLYESTLTREGSIYIPKWEIMLGGTNGKG